MKSLNIHQELDVLKFWGWWHQGYFEVENTVIESREKNMESIFTNYI